jgi:hypothetical protein
LPGPGLDFYITNSLLNAVLGGTIVGCVFIGLDLLSDLLPPARPAGPLTCRSGYKALP